MASKRSSASRPVWWFARAAAFLTLTAGPDERDVRSSAADREVADRARRLDAVVGVLGDLQRAQWVAFEAVAGARNVCRQGGSRRAAKRPRRGSDRAWNQCSRARLEDTAPVGRFPAIDAGQRSVPSAARTARDPRVVPRASSSLRAAESTAALPGGSGHRGDRRIGLQEAGAGGVRSPALVRRRAGRLEHVTAARRQGKCGALEDRLGLCRGQCADLPRASGRRCPRRAGWPSTCRRGSSS